MRKIAWLCKVLFSRKSEALVFVDYEYWFYTMRNLLHIAPVWDKLIAEGYWDPEKQCALQKVPESVLSGAV